MTLNNSLLTKINSDILGASASFLCFIHCIITPFLFMAQTGFVVFDNGAPIWWGWIEYIMLIVSFFAVYRSAKRSTIKIIKVILWVNWAFLFFLITNERIHLFELPEWLIYLPAIGLILSHLYNHKYGGCKTESC